jgi:hypothetical protein
MRVRIKQMRVALVEKLKAAGVKQDMSLHHAAGRHVQLLGPGQGADGAPARRVRRLRHRHRPHLRGGPEQQEHRLRLPVDRQGVGSDEKRPFRPAHPASGPSPSCGFILPMRQGSPVARGLTDERPPVGLLYCTAQHEGPRMLYQIYEAQRSLMEPFADFARPPPSFTATRFRLSARTRWPSASPPATTWCTGSGRTTRSRPSASRPSKSTASTSSSTSAVEIDKPFCELRRFKRFSDDPATLTKLKAQPVVLIVAPLSGHYATLLRDTVRSMLKDHKVYITDWKNARMVPLSSKASSTSTTTSTTCRNSSATCRACTATAT